MLVNYIRGGGGGFDTNSYLYLNSNFNTQDQLILK